MAPNVRHQAFRSNVLPVEPQVGAGFVGSADAPQDVVSFQVFFFPAKDAPPKWSLPLLVYHSSPVSGWKAIPTLFLMPAHMVAAVQMAMQTHVSLPAHLACQSALHAKGACLHCATARPHGICKP